MSSLLLTLKQLLLRLLPESFNPRVRLTRNLTTLAAGKVQSGPFKGMHFVDHAIAGAYFPELLGIYEKELHDAIGRLVDWRPSQIIHIGAAEGYYVVGLARLTRCPQIAFEAQPQGRQLCAELARLNQVEDLVEIRGFCSLVDLHQLKLSGPRIAVFCDVEGAEVELLNPENAPWLKRSWIIVECHPHSAPDVLVTIPQAFSATHDVELLTEIPRTTADCPKYSWLDHFIPAYYQIRFVSDGRGQKTPWLVLTPKAGG